MRPARILALLGSWWLTALLLIACWAVYLALSFGRNPYPAWVAFLFHSSAGLALLLGLITNLLAASIRITLARLREPNLSPEYVRGLDIHTAVPLQGGRTVEEALALLGLPAGPPGTAKRLRHVTGRWSFLPGTLFRIGLIVTLASLLVSVNFRRTGDQALREGERIDLLGRQVMVTGISADLPPDHLQVGEEGTFLLEGVSALLTVEDASATITPGFPARIKGQWYRVRHLGYSQELSVTMHGATRELVADLDLLPPGRQAVIPIAEGSKALTVSLAPDRTITKGLLTGRQFNLKRPTYLIGLNGWGPATERSSRRMGPGQQAQVGPGRVRLGKQGISVRIQAVSDPGLLPLYGGVLITLAGLCAMLSRFFWYARESVLLESEGTLLIGTRDEFYKKWGVERFQRWAERLAALKRP